MVESISKLIYKNKKKIIQLHRLYEDSLLECGYMQVQIIASYESRTWQADSSKTPCLN